MRFVVRVPTSSSRISLEAKVDAENWRDALRAVLNEIGRGEDVLERAHIHIRRDGRIVVEDPDTLRLFELRPFRLDESDPGLVPPPQEPDTVTQPRGHLPAVIEPQMPRPSQPASTGLPAPNPDRTVRFKTPHRVSTAGLDRPAHKVGSQPALLDPSAQAPAPPAATPARGASSGPMIMGAGESAETEVPKPSVIVNMGGRGRGGNASTPALAGFTAEPIPVVVVDTSEFPLVARRPSKPSRPKSIDLDAEDPRDAERGPLGAGAGQARPMGRMDAATVAMSQVPTGSPAGPGTSVGSMQKGGSVATRRVQDLRAGKELDQVAGPLLRSVRGRIRARAGVVLVPDARHKHVIIAAGFGLPKGFKMRKFRFGDGVGGFVCEFDSPINVDDIPGRPDLMGELEEVFTSLTSVVAAPVRDGGDTLGAVELFRSSGESFDDTEYNLLQEICRQQARLIR